MLYPTELRPRAGGTDLTAVCRRTNGLCYFIVGMTNCAPSRADVGQRDVTVFSLV